MRITIVGDPTDTSNFQVSLGMERKHVVVQLRLPYLRTKGVAEFRESCEARLLELDSSAAELFLVEASAFSSYMLHTSCPSKFELGPTLRHNAPHYIHAGRAFRCPRVSNRYCVIFRAHSTPARRSYVLDVLERVAASRQLNVVPSLRTESPTQPNSLALEARRHRFAGRRFALVSAEFRDGAVALQGYDASGDFVSVSIRKGHAHAWIVLPLRLEENLQEEHYARYGKDAVRVDEARFFYDTVRRPYVVRVKTTIHQYLNVYANRHDTTHEVVNRHIGLAAQFLMEHRITYGDTVYLDDENIMRREIQGPVEQFTGEVVYMDVQFSHFPARDAYMMMLMHRGTTHLFTSDASVKKETFHDIIDKEHIQLTVVEKGHSVIGQLERVLPSGFVAIVGSHMIQHKAQVVRTILRDERFFFFNAQADDPLTMRYTSDACVDAPGERCSLSDLFARCSSMRQAAEKAHVVESAIHMCTVCRYISLRDIQTAPKPHILKFATQGQMGKQDIAECLVFPETKSVGCALKNAEPFMKPGLSGMFAEIDFASMFPSIIAAHNIDALTFQRETDDLKGVYDEGLYGPFASLMQKLIHFRQTLDEGPQRTAIKLTTNACTGVLGLLWPHLYNSMTAHARAYLTEAIQHFEATVHGSKVHHANTDGFYLSFRPDTLPQVKASMEQINTRLKSPIRLTLKSNTLYKNGVFFKGNSLAGRGLDKRTVTTKGLVKNELGACDFAKSFQEALVFSVLQNEAIDVEQLASFTAHFTQKLLDGRVPREKLVLRTEVKDLLPGKTPTTKHGVLYKRLVENGTGKFPLPGERIAYLLVVGPDGDVVADVPTSRQPVHYESYMKRAILKNLRIFSSFGTEATGDLDTYLYSKALERFDNAWCIPYTSHLKLPFFAERVECKACRRIFNADEKNQCACVCA